MTVSAEGLTDEEVITSIEEALANELNVHPSDVEVEYDSETGVVTYTITSDDAESLNDVISDMQTETFDNALDIIDGLSIDDYVAPDDITATVDVVVDASNVADADSTATDVINALQEQDSDYEIDGDGKHITLKKL